MLPLHVSNNILPTTMLSEHKYTDEEGTHYSSVQYVAWPGKISKLKPPPSVCYKMLLNLTVIDVDTLFLLVLPFLPKACTI